MEYVCSRGGDEGIVRCADTCTLTTTNLGGLFVPDRDKIPDLSSQIPMYQKMDFVDVVTDVLSQFGLIDDIPKPKLRELVVKAYANFRSNNVLDIIKKGENFFVELFSGPTLAFKDFALAFVGVLLEYLLEIKGKNAVILAATSGDTGAAAIANVASKNTFLHVLYPHGGMSDGQESMTLDLCSEFAQAYAMAGLNFDDCQSIFKRVSDDKEFIEFLDKEKDTLFVSVNSVNWIRILVQAAYVCYAVTRVDRQLDIIVPSGNFGHSAGVLLAKMAGLNIGRIKVASNDNDILTRVINTGAYFPGDLKKTVSPAMDIVISSNFERVLYFLLGAERTSQLMSELKVKGGFQLSYIEKSVLQSYFDAESVDEATTLQTIEKFADRGYLLDPHGAVGASLLNQDSKDQMVLLTAHPAKFLDTIQGHAPQELVDQVMSELPDDVLKVFQMTEQERAEKRIVSDFSDDEVKELLTHLTYESYRNRHSQEQACA